MQVVETFTPSDVIPFPENIRFNPGLGWSERVFLAEICDITKQGQSVQMSSRKLAKVFNVSYQTIINWIKKLDRMGFINVEYSPQKGCTKFTIKSADIK